MHIFGISSGYIALAPFGVVPTYHVPEERSHWIPWSSWSRCRPSGFRPPGGRSRPSSHIYQRASLIGQLVPESGIRAKHCCVRAAPPCTGPSHAPALGLIPQTRSHPPSGLPHQPTYPTNHRHHRQCSCFDLGYCIANPHPTITITSLTRKRLNTCSALLCPCGHP